MSFPPMVRRPGTAESWSNLTLNESFADFSETFGLNIKHGKDAGDAANYKDIEKYLADPSNPSKDLVRITILSGSRCLTWSVIPKAAVF